jgi:hypothetical protein
MGGYAPVVFLILLPRSSPFRPCPQLRIEHMIAVVSFIIVVSRVLLMILVVVVVVVVIVIVVL